MTKPKETVLQKMIERDCKEKLRNKDWSEQEKKRYISGYTSAAKKFYAEKEKAIESIRSGLERYTDFRNIYPYNAFFIVNKEGILTLPDGTSVSILEIPPVVLKKVMHNVLNEEQERVLEYRLGGYTGSLMTLEEAGFLMGGLVRARVRQLEAQAIHVLRKPETAKMLVAATCDLHSSK